MLNKLLVIKASSLLFLMLIGISSVFGQQKTIRGVVTDAASGETLIGVNVTFVGDAGQGTVTDIDGAYQLAVPDTLSALRYSYVGYTTQIIPVTSDLINVYLVAGEELDVVNDKHVHRAKLALKTS